MGQIGSRSLRLVMGQAAGSEYFAGAVFLVPTKLHSAIVLGRL